MLQGFQRVEIEIYGLLHAKDLFIRLSGKVLARKLKQELLVFE